MLPLRVYKMRTSATHVDFNVCLVATEVREAKACDGGALALQGLSPGVVTELQELTVRGLDGVGCYGLQIHPCGAARVVRACAN